MVTFDLVKVAISANWCAAYIRCMARLAYPAKVQQPDAIATSRRSGFYLLSILAALNALTGPAKSGAGVETAPLTEKDTVVLTNFVNKTQDPAFDAVLNQALALELGQSPFLNFLSDRRASETLRTLGHDVNAGVTPDVGLELCRSTGGKAAISGAISDLSDHYLIELTANACSTGDTLAQARAEAAGKTEVLQSLSLASSSLRARLGESSASVQKFAVPVNVTTFSLAALKDYSTGMAVRREKGDIPSIPFLKHAIELDANFPLAYAELAAIYGNLRQPSLALEYAGKAYQLRDRVSEREKLKVCGIYYLATGDLEKEIQNYAQWQTQYPGDYVPYNNLGNDYAALGQLDQSLAEYQLALQLMPSVIGYTNVVGMNLSLNRLDAAGAALDAAFARKLDGRYLRQNLYWLAFLRLDAAQMERQVAWAAGKPGDEDALLSMQSDTDAYYGRLMMAQQFTERAVNSAVGAGSREVAALWQVNAALRSAELGNAVLARQDVTAALALSSGREVKVIAALALARTGDDRQASMLTQELKKDYPTDSLMKLYWLPCIDAAIALNQGNSSRALQDLAGTASYELGGAGTFINYLYPAFLRGQAFLLAHNGKAAAPEFQKLLDHSGVVLNFVTGALAHLQLGRAEAIAGDTAKARAAYRDFLTLWKDADPEIFILKQAKVEYAKLRPPGEVD